jgi:hypothetical protein
LDDNERAQMREAMQKRRMQEQSAGGGSAGSGNKMLGQSFGQHGGGGEDSPQRQAFRQRMLEKFDANHDGQLDDNERAQMHEFMQRRRQEREQGGGGLGGPSGGGRSGGPGGGQSDGPPSDGPPGADNQ